MDENQVIETVPTLSDDMEQQEKMLSQSEVNKIVQREKIRAAQSAKREVEERYQRDLEAIQAQSQHQSQRNENIPREIDADAIYQQVQERFNAEMQQKQLEQNLSQVADNYLSKMRQGPEVYDDFEEVTKDFDPTAFPQLIYLVSGIDNAADVIYDLSKNPLKLAGLDRIAEKNPRQAHSELLKLSRSIAENRQALNDAGSQSVSAPLDRLQPSKVSGSNGKMGIRDLRSQDWLRG